MLNTLILKMAKTGGTISTDNTMIKTIFTQVPTPKYKVSNIYLVSNMGSTPLFFIILGAIVMYIRLILQITEEKEFRIQEN